MLDTIETWRFNVKRILAILTVLLLAGTGSVSAETVWKWTGKDGKPVFGEQAPAGIKAEQVDIREANVGDLGPTGNVDGSDRPGTAATLPGRGNPLAKIAMQPVEIGGKVVESGSVRLKARAEGRDLNPGRATCPPELPVCRKKGDAPTSGRPRPPRQLQGGLQPAP